MKTNANDAAYPSFAEFDVNDDTKTISVSGYDGLTKREYFAAMALQGLLSTKGSYFPNQQNTGELAALASVHYADALIAELNKEGQNE